MYTMFFSTLTTTTSFSMMMSCTILAALFIFFTTVPVFSLLSLVLAYIFAAMSLFLLDLPYVSLVYIILYVGAVCTLFIFLIMLVELRPDAEYIKKNIRKGLVVIVVLGLFLTILLLFQLINYNGIASIFTQEKSFLFTKTLLVDTVLSTVEYRDINVLNIFYTQYTRNYPILFLLAAALLIAVIGCIVIAFNRPFIYSAIVRKLITLPLLYAFYPFTRPNGDIHIISDLNPCFTAFAFSTSFIIWMLIELYNGPLDKYRELREKHPFKTRKQIAQNDRMLGYCITLFLIGLFILVCIIIVSCYFCFFPWLVKAAAWVMHEIFRL